MNQREMQQALTVLQEVYGGMLERLTESVRQNEDGLRGSPYSFAYQEVEDRFAPRVVSLSHLIGALQSACARPTVDEYRVETVISTADDLSREVNEKLKALRGARLKDVSLQKLDDGRFLVMLTLARTVASRAPQRE